MRSFLLAITLACTTALPLRSQSTRLTQRYVEAETTGAKAVSAGKLDEAIAAFTECHALAPRDGRSAYNLACCHALKRDLDTAFEWLTKATEYGFALEDREFELLETKDSDLTAVRNDPRFATLITTAKTRRTNLRDYASTPVVYIPEALKSSESLPLLVVLHDAGETKVDAFARGPWKRLADALGFALVIPSAKLPVADDVSQGMRWFDWMFNFADSPFAWEHTVTDAVSSFRKEHKLDASKVFLVGQGQGGMVAFDVATSAPGLYKGVVVVQSTILPGLAQSKGPNAGKLGLKAKVLMGSKGVYGLEDDAAEIEANAKATEGAFRTWKIQGRVERFARAADAPDPTFDQVKSALEEFLAPSDG